jgi:plastocyanin
MSRRTIFLLVAIALVAVALSACGGGAAQSAPLAVTVKTTEFKFDPGTINAAPGQSINLTLDNTKGSVDHTFVLPAANVKMTVPAGKTGTQTFTAPAAGSYDFTCDVAGHKEAGMTGKLVVK